MLSLGFVTFSEAQTPDKVAKSEKTGDTLVKIQQLNTTDTKNQAPTTTERKLIDGVAAVIGEELILYSDIQKMYKDMKSQGVSTEGVTDCDLAIRLMKNKLYAHQAIQDSITVNEEQIRAQTNQQVEYFVEQKGNMENLLEFYNLDSEVELRTKLSDINKETRLAQKMQEQIVESVEITPEEVRAYFEGIPEDKRPQIGDEVEISKLVIEPEVPQKEIDKVIAKLKEFRKEILSGESTFATKAVLYSEDPGSSTRGGLITLNRNSRFVREFMQAAFSLQEGEISKPFKSQYGYHILTVDKIRGQERDVRHILLTPKVTRAAKNKAKQKIDSIRQLIVSGEMDFFNAARKFSDEEETRGDGGKLINGINGTRFDQTNLPPSLYNIVATLEEGKVSNVLTDYNRTGRVYYQLVIVNKRYPAHVADFTKDYIKIKELALQHKKLEEVAKWQEETIENTYVKINGKLRNCPFEENWLKK